MHGLTKVLALVILAASLLSPSGCAFLTTKRIATMAGKHVAKKGYEKFKEDREEKKHQDQEERIERTSYDEPN